MKGGQGQFFYLLKLDYFFKKHYEYKKVDFNVKKVKLFVPFTILQIVTFTILF